MAASIAQQADELDDADMWVRKLGCRSDEFKQIAHCLKDIEFSLRCFQCNDFLRAPATVIPCRHTFCSECLRTKFTLDLNSTARKASCALCNASVDTTGSDYGRCLEPNRIVDNLVQTYRIFREPLLEQLMKLEGVEELPKLLMAAKQGAAASEIITKGGSSSSDAGNRVLTSLHTISSVFHVPFPTLPPALPDPRPKQARTIYKGKNRRQLVELCNSAGLAISGDEVALQKRHKEYITLYNSECDSLRPRSNQELLAVIESRSQQRDLAYRAGNRGGMDQNRYFSICLEKLKQERKKLGESNTSFFSSVPTGYDDFDRDMEEGFTQLIQEYRKGRPIQMRRPWVDTTDYESIAALATASSSQARSLLTHSKKFKTTKKSPFFAYTKSHVTTVANASRCSEATRSVAPGLPFPPHNRPKVRAEIPKSDIDLEKVAHSTPMQQLTPIQPKTTGSVKDKEFRLRATVLGASSVHTSLEPSTYHLVSDSNATKSGPDMETFDLEMSTKVPVHRSYQQPKTVRSHEYQETRLQAMTFEHSSGTPMVQSIRQEVALSPFDDNECKRKFGCGPNSRGGLPHKSPKSSTIIEATTIGSDEPCLLGPWTCLSCTFFNTKKYSTMARCEMCDSQRIVKVQTTVYEID